MRLREQPFHWIFEIPISTEYTPVEIVLAAFEYFTAPESGSTVKAAFVKLLPVVDDAFNKRKRYGASKSPAGALLSISPTTG